MDDWRVIEEFPEYSVSRNGQVRNDKTGRLMTLFRNQTGVINVGLTAGHKQYKRSVAVLVARAFLPEPTPDTFDTPTHKDGDLSNCSVENLIWRPRWFAIRYHMQFRKDRKVGLNTPIREIHTGEVFPNSWAAATKYGLLDREIVIAIFNRTYVSPTFQVFEQVE